MDWWLTKRLDPNCKIPCAPLDALQKARIFPSLTPMIPFFFHPPALEMGLNRRRYWWKENLLTYTFWFDAQKVIAGAFKPSDSSVVTSTMIPCCRYFDMLGQTIKYKLAISRIIIKMTLIAPLNDITLYDLVWSEERVFWNDHSILRLYIVVLHC